MADEWKVKRGDQEWLVPDSATLQVWAREKRVLPDDYVFNPVLQRWMYAREAGELATSFAAAVSGPFLCTNCGYTGPSVRVVPGSNAVGCLLLILFVIPGLIYAVWQQTQSGPGCPSCKQRTLIPIGSPQAQEILARRART